MLLIVLNKSFILKKKKSNIKELVRECETIQTHLPKELRTVKRFATMVFNNNFKGAMSLIVNKAKGGVLPLNEQTKKDMKSKHPKAERVESAIHAMRDFFEQDSNDGVLLIDADNAFNRVNRAVALWNVQFTCPAMKHVLINFYRNSTRIFMNGDGTAVTRRNNTGLSTSYGYVCACAEPSSVRN